MGDRWNAYAVMWGDLRDKDHLRDLCVDGGINLKWNTEQWRGIDWIDVAQDKDRWRALVNAVMNLLVP